MRNALENRGDTGATEEFTENGTGRGPVKLCDGQTDPGHAGRMQSFAARTT